MKKIVLWALVLLWMAPVTLHAGWGWGNKNKEVKNAPATEQKQDVPQARQVPKEKTPEEKEAAIQQRREAQLASNKVVQQAMHDKQMDELKTKLAQNKKLTETQKNEILAAREKQHNESTAYGVQRRSENATFFQTLADDPKMTEVQKREAIRAHFQSQKPANQAFRQRQKADSQAEREKILAESSSANTVAQ